MVVLAIWVAHELHEVVDVALASTWKREEFRLAAQDLVACLGPEKSKSLPVFHAFTGCNTVSAMAWEVWNTFPDVTDAFLCLASECLHILCLPLKYFLYCYMITQAHALMSFGNGKENLWKEYLEHRKPLNSI